MVASCGAGAIFYMLPMLLGRTYDMQHDKVGIDIFERNDVEEAIKNAIPNPHFSSLYQTVENSREKRDFLGVSGEIGVKIGSGLLDIRGAGEYLKDTSNLDNTVEILIKLTFLTVIQEISPNAKPMTYWQLLDQNSVGTHVVTSLTYGGEVYASVNFVAHKAEDFNSIKAEVIGSISKSGAFDLEAQGKLEKVAKNLTNRAKMEIDYFANVPIEIVPTTLEGLRILVHKFQEQVQKVNGGLGVPVCAGLRALSDFSDKFQFLKNRELVNSLEDFSYLYNNLREAKTLLYNLVTSLPEMVTQEYLNKIIDFSGRLTDTLRIFNDVIGNMDLEKGSSQLAPAETAFDKNSAASSTDTRYTKEVRRLIAELFDCIFTEDPSKPRGLYIRWGRKTCGTKASNILYIGFMSSFFEKGIGAANNYQCLPENPDLKLGPEFTGLSSKRESKLSAARYRSMSVFKKQGKTIENKVAPCVVCETPMRPTVQMYPAMLSCPGDWVQEYTGFLVSTNRTKNRSEFACVDYEPETFDLGSPVISEEPVILPIRMGIAPSKKEASSAEASLPCVVCSK